MFIPDELLFVKIAFLFRIFLVAQTSIPNKYVNFLDVQKQVDNIKKTIFEYLWQEFTQKRSVKLTESRLFLIIIRMLKVQISQHHKKKTRHLLVLVGQSVAKALAVVHRCEELGRVRVTDERRLVNVGLEVGKEVKLVLVVPFETITFQNG